MYVTICVTMLTFALVIYIPGYLILRCFGCERQFSVCAAPAFSFALIAILSEIYTRTGIPANPTTMLCIPCAILCVGVIIRLMLHIPSKKFEGLEWRYMFLYAGIGLGVCLIFFLRKVPSAQSMFQGYDLIFHINLIRAFVDSQSFSSMSQSVYRTAADVSIAPIFRSEFYPAAWHEACALSEQLSGSEYTAVILGSVSLGAGLVFPLSMYVWMNFIFDNNRQMIRMGSIVASSFACFPWNFLIFGPLYANLYGFAILPVGLYLLEIAYNIFNAKNIKQNVCIMILTALCYIGMAFVHPNTWFTAGILFVVYIIYFAWSYKGKVTNRIVTLLSVLIIAGIWYLLYNLPILANTTKAINWNSITNKYGALVNLITVGYDNGMKDPVFKYCGPYTSQPFLGLIVIIGIFECLIKKNHRKYLLTYGIIGLISIINSSTNSGLLKHVLAGFWYTDQIRVGAILSIFAIPIATIGLFGIYSYIKHKISIYLNKNSILLNHNIINICALAAYLLIIFAGKYSIGGYLNVTPAYAAFSNDVKEIYSLNKPYSPDDRKFINDVLKLIPENSLVINYPYDGSVIAYGVDGIRTYYRNVSDYDNGKATETTEGILIRQRLVDYATDGDVQKAVKDLGVKYVIQLNKDNIKGSLLEKKASGNNFDGIKNINKNTAGFKVILQEYGCTLYEIN